MLRGWCILSDVICFFFFFALIQERPFAGYSVLLSVCSSAACPVLKENSTWDAFCGDTLVVCPAGNSAVQCNIYCLINFDNEYHSYERR